MQSPRLALGDSLLFSGRRRLFLIAFQTLFVLTLDEVSRVSCVVGWNSEVRLSGRLVIGDQVQLRLCVSCSPSDQFSLCGGTSQEILSCYGTSL